MIPQLNTEDVTFFKVTAYDTETCSLQSGLLTMSYYRVLHGFNHRTGEVVSDEEVFSHYSGYHQETEPVDPRAFDVHKISLDKAEALGVNRTQMINDLYLMVRDTHVLLGFNVAFDNKIILPFLFSRETDLDKKSWCVMTNTKDIVKATNKLGRLKNPNLGEAFTFFTGKDFANKHSSSADAFATLQVHIHALKHETYAKQFSNFIKEQILCLDSAVSAS